MAVPGEQAYTTSTEQPEELKRRNVATSQPNGTTAPIQVDEKTKQKVRHGTLHPGPVTVLLQRPADTVQAKSALSTWADIEPIVAPIIFIALAFFTRLWKIDLSPIVTWDEAQYAPCVQVSH